MDVASDDSADETGVSEPGNRLDGAHYRISRANDWIPWVGSSSDRSLRSLSAAGAFCGRWGIIGRALAIRGRRLLALRVIWPFR